MSNLDNSGMFDLLEENPIPLEQQNPEVAEFILSIVNKTNKQNIIGAYFSSAGLKLKKQIINTVKPNRNDPCSCGSNKKYKKCCGAN